MNKPALSISSHLDFSGLSGQTRRRAILQLTFLSLQAAMGLRFVLARYYKSLHPIITPTAGMGFKALKSGYSIITILLFFFFFGANRTR